MRSLPRRLERRVRDWEHDRMKVLNPKQIRQVVLTDGGTKLAPELIQRISHQLAQRCRDVEL